jgi:6-phosphogluconolactonase (cycloisomerase 2 family)
VNATTNQVSLFPIDQTNGALMGTGVLFPLAANADPQAIVADPTGRFLYVANKGTNKVSAYLIAAANGSFAELISLGSPFPVAPGIGPVSLSVDPLGQFLYVANETSQNVSAFAIDQATGALSVIGSLVSTTSPQSIAVDLSGQFVYVANGNPDNSVSAFVIQPNGGLSNTNTVTGSPFVASSSPSAITTVGRF